MANLLDFTMKDIMDRVLNLRDIGIEDCNQLHHLMKTLVDAHASIVIAGMPRKLQEGHVLEVEDLNINKSRKEQQSNEWHASLISVRKCGVCSMLLVVFFVYYLYNCVYLHLLSQHQRSLGLSLRC